jgi:hypothetical protein
MALNILKSPPLCRAWATCTNTKASQYKRALDEYRESLRILRAAYGNEHPEVAVALHNMGCVEL